MGKVLSGGPISKLLKVFILKFFLCDGQGVVRQMGLVVSVVNV